MLSTFPSNSVSLRPREAGHEWTHRCFDILLQFQKFRYQFHTFFLEFSLYDTLIRTSNSIGLEIKICIMNCRREISHLGHSQTQFPQARILGSAPVTPFINNISLSLNSLAFTLFTPMGFINFVGRCFGSKPTTPRHIRRTCTISTEVSSITKQLHVLIIIVSTPRYLNQRHTQRFVMGLL